MLKLNSIMLGSENPEKLAKFYGELLQSEPGMQEGDFVGYKAGDCFLTIGPHDKVKGKNDNPERIIYFFEASDVAAEFERIKKIEGAQVIAEPYQPGEETKFTLATLADPDGNYFQLSTPFDA